MRICVNSIELEGASRSVQFHPGLNVITGPIASGKTTLFRLIRSLLGGGLDNLPIEARKAVTSISGNIVLGQREYRVVRPAVTTRTTRVEIASDNVALRLPFAQADQESKLTYLEWLLGVLGLPKLEVPSAPTKPESEPTPVTLNDYLLYCAINQEDIGFSVFGHNDPFKNIKRRYVFEIVYGLYGIETAKIQDELRDVQARLRELRNQDKLFSRFLENTELENRAKIETNLQQAKQRLQELENEIRQTSAQAETIEPTERLRNQVLEVEARTQGLRSQLDSEKQALIDLERLANQLETQASRLTRAIVAKKHLGDIDFVICPRCGASVTQERSPEAICYLCLQTAPKTLPKETLIAEQARVEAQLSEVRDLFLLRKKGLDVLRNELGAAEKEEANLKRELDFQTETFVSAQAGKIAALSAGRAEAKVRAEQLSEYLKVYQNVDRARQLAEELAERKEELEQSMESAIGNESEVKERIQHLSQRFSEILEKFRPPEFGEEKVSDIDRRTYLPTYRGRRFDDLISPGLATLVTLAYALAHQLTSLDLNLNLPNILLVDGLSEHLGQEGLDPERIRAVYQFLAEISGSVGDLLQVIVVDNEVPDIAKSFVRLELSEEERLILA